MKLETVCVQGTFWQIQSHTLVIIDIFTKWIEAFLLMNTTSATLAKVLIDEVIWQYGVPTHLHGNQDANLCTAVIHLLGIHMTRSCAYHPGGNWQAE